jgi:hypothetical protein
MQLQFFKRFYHGNSISTAPGTGLQYSACIAVNKGST